MTKLLPYLLSALLFMMVITTRATVVIITQEDNTFSPASVNVHVGDTVRWVWTSGSHTTTSATIPAGAQAWNSPLTASVTQFDYVVSEEGTYNYVCTPHANIGMVGSFQATAAPLGLNDNLSPGSVKIYPNPAKDHASLKLTTEAPGKGILSVYDLLGNQISRTDVSIKQGLNTIPLAVENVDPGIYIIELKYNQSAIIRRFVKSR